ncbi:MAG: transcriptional regulator [Haloarcula sp.]
MVQQQNRKVVVSGNRLPSEQLDSLLEVLSAEPRRMIVSYLLEHDTAAVGELVDVVVGQSPAWEESDGDNWDQMRSALYHQHLPALAAADIVVYDTDEQTVQIASLPPSATELISTIRGWETT